jgi:hypothetical protein
LAISAAEPSFLPGEGSVQNIERPLLSQDGNRIMEVAHPRHFGHFSMTGMLMESETDFDRVG